MSTLAHSPAEIIAQAIQDLGVTWQVNVNNEPSLPDNVVTVYDTTGIINARLHNSGQHDESPGIQIRIRSDKYLDGWEIADTIRSLLDEAINYTDVDVDGTVFTVISFDRSTNVLSLGHESPESRRWVFVINGVVTVSPK